MVSGDGGMDIGMGSALGAALRNHHMIIFEYDNGGYMNTGYQLSYSTPLGLKVRLLILVKISLENHFLIKICQQSWLQQIFHILLL